MKPNPEADLLEYNRQAWNEQVENENRWTRPVSQEVIEEARKGKFEIVLTPAKPIPGEGFPVLKGCKVLCLASGGGQQGPVLAAAGADVTVYDYSENQLAQDRLVAEREGLNLETVHGDMADLNKLADNHFDLIVHPCSNTFVPNILPVWNESYRVLKPGGELLSGFCNPIGYIFDYEKTKKGLLEVRHKIPYSDTGSLEADERQQLIDDGEPFCFGHSLEDQIGGQTDAGFSIIGFYEDYWNDDKEPLDKYIASFIATRAKK